MSFFDSVHRPPLIPRWAATLNFVIPPAPACRGTGADQLFFRLCPFTSTHAKVDHCPQLCHPDCPGVPWDWSGPAFFRLCPSTSTHAKVDHCPQLCHPDWSGPGFPTSRYRPRRTKLDRKSGVAQGRDLQFHSDRTQMPTSDPLITQPIPFEINPVPHNQRITSPSPAYSLIWTVLADNIPGRTRISCAAGWNQGASCGLP
jgi:hypothetical protein